MKDRKIAGIDYSLTSPAICIYKEENSGHFDFDRCVLHYLCNNKKQQQLSAGYGLGNIKAELYPEWETAEERQDALSSWTISLIQGCDEVYIEGYAFAASGISHVRSIAENTGLLKHKMWKQRIQFTDIPPTVIKKFATGKGTANKDVMYESFILESHAPTDLKEQLTPRATKVKNPISDIVDAYFITKCGVGGLVC
jgi:hypothetical protein